MKTKMSASVIGVIGVVALLAICICGAVMAQGGPGNGKQMLPPHPPSIVEIGTNGVFALVDGTLHKYDASLGEAGSLKLVEMQKPESNQTRNQRPQRPGANQTDRQRPQMPMPTAMLISGGERVPEKLLVVVGDKFFAVDPARLEIIAEADLPAMERPQSSGEQTDNRGRQGRMGPNNGQQSQQQVRMPCPPPLELKAQGNLLYILRADQILAVDVITGNLIGNTTLPKLEPPSQNK